MSTPRSLQVDHQTAVADIQLHTHLQFFAIAILYYDWFLTLPQEISWVWTRKKSTVSWVFLVNRFLAVFGNAICRAVSMTPLTAEESVNSVIVCLKFALWPQLLVAANQFLTSIILIMRTYALYDRDGRILALTLGTGVMITGVCGWALIGQAATPQKDVPVCINARTLENGIHLAISWEGVFLFDSLIFTLTVMKTFRTFRSSNSNGLRYSAQLPLRVLIFRDGAIQYSIMAMANLANLITLYLGGPLLRGTLSTFASIIGVTLVSRVVLNLREAGFSAMADRPTDHEVSDVENFELSHLPEEPWGGQPNHNYSRRANTHTPKSSSVRRGLNRSDSTEQSISTPCSKSCTSCSLPREISQLPLPRSVLYSPTSEVMVIGNPNICGSTSSV